jgi:alanyl-tRNA synthetase
MNNIERVKKSIKRAGDLLPMIMGNERDIPRLSGEDVLYIFNTYAIPLETIILIAHSHNLEVDEIRFEKLLEDQEERYKNMKQC